MSIDVATTTGLTRLWFGGSFNPIHTGHLLVARAAAEAVRADRVVLVPSAQPPHKPQAADLAAATDRLNMCQAVARDDPFFEVADLELNRRGPSYTFDTICELRATNQGEIRWMIGADMLQILPTWHRITELLDLVRFVIVMRPGYAIDWSTLPHTFERLRSDVVVAPLIEISATDIRRRVREGHSIKYLTPPGVEDFILGHGLYRG
jgi:nicotinate-nucleotide adenylyltransferase